MTRRVLFLALLSSLCPFRHAFQSLLVTVRTSKNHYKDGSRLHFQRCLPLTETLRVPTALGAAKKFRNFEEMLNHYHDKPVLVSFHSTLCGPCRLQKKELKAVREEVGDTSVVFVVDTERWPSLGVRYHVRGLPTILIFKQGQILYQHEGVETAEELVRRVKELL